MDHICVGILINFKSGPQYEACPLNFKIPCKRLQERELNVQLQGILFWEIVGGDMTSYPAGFMRHWKKAHSGPFICKVYLTSSESVYIRMTILKAI